MGFSDTINVMLPPLEDGTSADVTSPYGKIRDKGPHGGTDFNYRNSEGQSSIHK